ncbi:MAG: (2Fe-2S)-binding protein [Gallionella sp.]|nr:(2Fe-2S)-binding protein [Gallionella sp.]
MSDESVHPADEVMCQCSGTKRGYIQSLYEQGMDVQAISRWTGALSGCGGCEWDIADFLKALDQQKVQADSQTDRDNSAG